MAQEYTAQDKGSLEIATTHTQSRYILPEVIKGFITRYPEVSLHMHQGSPMQISQLAADGTADFAIATEALELFSNLVMMPCFKWNRCILVPKNHPLCQESRLSLKQVAAFPIVTYVYGFTGRSKLDEAFRKQRIWNPKSSLPRLMRTLSRPMFGSGWGSVLLPVWLVEERDDDLVALDASHLFEYSTTSIGFRRETYMRSVYV